MPQKDFVVTRYEIMKVLHHVQASTPAQALDRVNHGQGFEVSRETTHVFKHGEYGLTRDAEEIEFPIPVEPLSNEEIDRKVEKDIARMRERGLL